MKSLKGRMLLFIFMAGIWLLLTYPFSAGEAAVGGAVALVLAVFPMPGSKVFSEMRLGPKALFAMFRFFFVFLFALVKSNLDVAMRVVKPRLNIYPGIVKVRTKLKSDLGRALLANAITLTPGTITVDARGEYFYIHWIDVKTKDLEQASKQLVEGFEKYLEPGCG